MSESSTTAALQDLLSRFAAGEETAKNVLVERAHARLIVLARGQLGRFPRVRQEEETAAVLGLSYQRLSKALDDLRPTTVRDFFALAALQMKRVLLDLVRRTPAPDGDPPTTDVPGPGGTPGGTLIDILNAIAKLSDKEREVVDLIFFGGLTQREAAEVLDVHEDTVKRIWAGARIKLAKLLKDYGPLE